MTEKPNSVLIVRLSAIGDVIHALPVLDALRQLLPDARLGWVVEELSAPLLENHPQLDKLYVIPKKRWKKYWHGLYFSEIRPFFKQIRADGWDVAIDLQGLTKSGYVASRSGAKHRIGYGDYDSRELNRIFINDKIVPPEWAVHVVERNLSLIEGLSLVPPKDARGRLGIKSEEREAMRQQLAEAGVPAGEKILALNPGAGWASKLWDPKYYGEVGAALAKRKKLHPLVLWGPGEENLRDALSGELTRLSIEHTVAPPTKIRELAVLISLCHFYIGGDTGPTHIAGLLKIPHVAIFGASDARRNRPWPRENGTAIQLDTLSCVPCWKTKCPLPAHAEMACLKDIKPGRVIEAAIELLERGRTGARIGNGGVKGVLT